MLKSTIQLLRFHFSFFLMPVFWFAASLTNHFQLSDAILIFIILHLILYPSSNGYNSYMDRDEGSIGGIKNPMKPTKQLYYVSVVMDMAAIFLGSLISNWFALGIFLYILASRAYSYRGIRLKKYPVAGLLTVMIFQGGLIFWLVMHGLRIENSTQVPWLGMIAASLLVGSFYPLTQIYQHIQDKKDGVKTISMVLGYKGTFICTAILFTLAMICMTALLLRTETTQLFIGFNLFFLPTLLFFGWWMIHVFKDSVYANYSNTMKMNIISSVCSNAAFIYLFIQLH